MPVPQPDEVMELAVQLKQARNRVIELESRWESFFAQSPAAVQPAAISLRQRIVQFLEARPDISYSTASVAQALNAKENSVGPYLSDMAKEGTIERRGRGLYGSNNGPAVDQIYESEREARLEEIHAEAARDLQ